MMIRFHFTEDGQPIDPQRVVSRSPRVFTAIRNGRVELTMLPPGQGWARKVAVAKVRPHPPLLEQLEALATLIDNARNEDGLAASKIAENNAAILSHARELASSIGDATIAMADTGLRGIEREAKEDIDRVRTIVRRHPLRSVGLAVIASALLIAIYRR
jgi:hypothetical protein